MKRLVWTTIFSLAIAVATAQVKDLAFARVKYRFTHISDTTQPENPHKETMMLLLGKEASAYQSYDKILRDSILTAQVEQQARSGSRSITIDASGMQQVSGTVIYKTPATGKQSRLESMMGYFLIDDGTITFDWQVHPDTKKIGELECQKATTRFRGRNYTAWFCPQLPYSNGPWRFGGLPGLILEASDDRNEVVFAFDSFEDVSGRKMNISTPLDVTLASQKEFDQMKEAFRKDPQGFGRTRMAASGVVRGVAVGGAGPASGSLSTANISSITVNSATGTRRRVENNPIEKNEP